MAEYTIDKFEYDGNVYKLQDNVSGYTTNTGTITSVKTTAGAHTTINVSSGAATFNVPTKTSHLTNDSGFIISPNVVYCTCGTASGTVTKVATIESGSLTSLNKGDQAIVKFTNSNAIASPMLKIGTTDAKSIKRYGTTAPSDSSSSSWNAGSAVLFIYDGTYWQMVGWLNTTYSEISTTNITNGSNATTGLITGRRAKAAVEAFAPVKDVTVGGTSVMSGTTAVVPAIPTVNDATLTIQKNGTNVATFTANASSNVTANISVPTDTGDLTNGAGYITSAGGTSTPTANTVAKFDGSAHMNSGDMSAQDVSDFVSGLNIPLAPDIFVVTQGSSDLISTAASTNGYVTFSVTNSGYYPLGIVGYELEWFAGQTALINIYIQKLVSATNGSGVIECNFRNMHTATTEWKFKPYVLWVRSRS